MKLTDEQKIEVLAHVRGLLDGDGELRVLIATPVLQEGATVDLRVVPHTVGILKHLLISGGPETEAERTAGSLLTGATHRVTRSTNG